jgi:hypothetical protein
MCARTADFRGLISAFHRDLKKDMGKSWVLDGGVTMVVNQPASAPDRLWITSHGVVEC